MPTACEPWPGKRKANLVIADDGKSPADDAVQGRLKVDATGLKCAGLRHSFRRTERC